MSRLTLPSFVRDLTDEPRSLRTLALAVLALGAAGFDPRVFWPGLASVQAAVRERPQVETLLLAGALTGAVMLLVGGVLGDADGRRRIQVIALGVLTATSLTGLLIPDGPVFMVGRFVGAAAASIILPIALAGVATSYQGVARATAIGLAYAAYGGAMAAMPVLLTIMGPTGPRWPAFVVATAVSAIAFMAHRRGWRDLPQARRADRRRIVSTACFAAGVIFGSVGVIQAGGRAIDATRLVLIALGVAAIIAARLIERGDRTTTADDVHIDRRPVAVALFVGFIIAAAQAGPILQLPIYLQVLSGYSPILAVVATVPFMAALVATGPIAGLLLSRVGPRALLTGGVAAMGLGNLALGLVMGRDTSLLVMILPLIALGAGFVVATTVRTAIIFASVPRGLPATAAALNEASVALGTRIGLVAVTTVITTVALDRFAGSMAGQPAAQVVAATAAFEDLLAAIGMPGFTQLAAGVDPTVALTYADAYTVAIRVSLMALGVIALGAAAVTWFVVGARPPLTSVWEHRDERLDPGADAVSPAG